MTTIERKPDAEVIKALWSLSPKACRMLLASAWVRYGRNDGVGTLRCAVRSAFARGVIAGSSIIASAGVK